MPTEKTLYQMSLPSSIFDGRTDFEIVSEVLKDAAILQQTALHFDYYCDGSKGKIALENDGQTIFIYVTELTSIKREFVRSFTQLAPFYLWNIFRLHRPKRYEESYEGERWTYVLLAPRDRKDDLPEFQLKKHSGEIVAKFLFYDWLFECSGGSLDLIEVYRISYDGSLTPENRKLSLQMLKMI